MGYPKLEDKDPEAAERILQAIETGMGVTEIARRFKVTRDQVYALERRHETRLSKFQDRLLRKWRRAANGSIERLGEAIENGSIKDSQLAYVAGVATDKVLSLSGAPTAVVVHEKKPDPEELRKAIQEAAQQLRRAEAVQVPNEDQTPQEDQEKVIGGVPPGSGENNQILAKLPKSLQASARP